MIAQSPAWGRGIDRLGQGAKADPARFQILHQRDEVRKAPSEPIETQIESPERTNSSAWFNPGLCLNAPDSVSLKIFSQPAAESASICKSIDWVS